MAELSTDQRAKLGAGLIEQAPPGEVNDVINAIRAIVGDDDALMAHAGPALRAYNLVQLTVVEHAAKEGSPAHVSVLSEAAIVPGTSGETERYIDAVGKQTFKFDHINVVASEYEPYTLPEDEEGFRAELAKSLAAYAKNHYPTGQSSVNCSQYPLVPSTLQSSEPIPDTAATEASSSDVKTEDSAAPIPAADADGIVTDVIPEQVGAGSSEPAPTPAVEDEKTRTEEVVQEGGLEKVDELVEDIKEVQMADEAGESSGEKPEETSSGEPGKVKVADVPEVVEVEDTETMPSTEEVAISQTEDALESGITKEGEVERKQERVENPTFTLEIVGNRYKTDAFWTGRWRTCWTVDKAAGKVSGKLLVDVHYFEQGNVQLTTSHNASFDYPSEVSGQSIASQIVTTISKVEAAYQIELQDVYGDLGDKVFRSLRRALPVTRQKVDWEKVGGYSLGSDISKARS